MTLAKGLMCKTVDKEVESFNQNASNFHTLKLNMVKKIDSDFCEANNSLDNEEEETLKYKVSEKQIKHHEHIAKQRKEQYESLYSKCLMVQKITNDINFLTHSQDKKIEKIDDNVEPVLLNAKDTFKKLLETSTEEKNFKNNNCCLLLIVILSVFLLLLIFLNYNRDN